MLEMMALGLTIVVAYVVAGLGMMALFMNKKFVKKFVKKYIKMCNEIAEELDDLDD